MTLADLLFLFMVLTATGTLLTMIVRAMQGRPIMPIFRRLLIGFVGYVAVLLGASLLSPQRYAKLGDSECSDDWCIALRNAMTRETSAGQEYLLQLELTSHALGRPQRERFVSVLLLGEDGQRFQSVLDLSQVPFDTLLAPGESVLATRRFVVARGVRVAGMIVVKQGVGRIPGCCIIGQENSFWHKPTVIRFAR